MKDYEDKVQMLLAEDSITHLLAGLAAECGEVCGLFQKAIYKGTNAIHKDELLSELGDVLFYLTALLTKYDMTLEQAQQHNITKLNKRWDKGE